MAGFVRVARLSDVPPGSMKAVLAGQENVALINLDGQIFALDDTCTHAYCSAAAGEQEGDRVTCLCHGSSFSVRTGEVLVPPAKEPLRTYRVLIEGEDILVEG